MIEAKIIADSKNALDHSRLTTFQLRYPRFIHSELMTHKVFSRSASSSRAVPVKQELLRVLKDPAMPVAWGENQRGMQAAKDLTGVKLFLARRLWLLARYPVVLVAWLMSKLNLHKQVANRLLEPWQHIDVVVTSSRWANFYALRTDRAAQPEMRALAEAMLRAHKASTPVVKMECQWHLPYITEEEMREHGVDLLVRMSAARCARVSYRNHDGSQTSLINDLALYERLMGGAIKHASPTEHQAMVSFAPMRPSNFHRHWSQFRKTIEGENIESFEGFTE